MDELFLLTDLHLDQIKILLRRMGVTLEGFLFGSMVFKLIFEGTGIQTLFLLEDLEYFFKSAAVVVESLLEVEDLVLGSHVFDLQFQIGELDSEVRKSGIPGGIGRKFPSCILNDGIR